jgi:hypothetical protein
MWGERLVADRGVDHVARLLAYALRDLDKAQGKAWVIYERHDWSVSLRMLPADSIDVRRLPTEGSKWLDTVTGQPFHLLFPAI